MSVKMRDRIRLKSSTEAVVRPKESNATVVLLLPGITDVAGEGQGVDGGDYFIHVDHGGPICRGARVE